MKKRNNKIIILVLIGIIFATLLGVFILNYSKDDSSFSLLEKKWISDNTSNIFDVSVYNDVPIYGKKGQGIIFDFLEEFTKKYGINFNKVSYSISNASNLKDVAFKIISNNTDLTDKDLLLYKDHYVLVSNKVAPIDNVSDIEDIDITVLEEDIGLASNYLSDAKNVSFSPKENISAIEDSIDDQDDFYALLPYNMYIDFIYRNGISLKYV